MINDLLFVYGSLLNNDNEFAHYLRQNADVLEPAFFKGRLFDCGEYPGAIADDAGYDIHGTIYRLNVNTALAILDDYEGFGYDQEQPNLFVRQMAAVKNETKIVNCWVYLYNLPVNGLTEITSGDYISYIGT